MRPILLCAFALAACSAKPVPDENICVTPVAEKEGEDFLACIHREAYWLAKAPGRSKEISEAVVAGCVHALQEFVEQDKTEDGDVLYSSVHKSAEDFALYFVTQARAGNCAVPVRKR